MRDICPPRPGIVAGLLIAFCFSSHAPAQVAAVEILNTTGEAGATIADVVLPLKRGLTKVAPMLRTDRGKICHVRPLGARWPDGSLRYLRVDLPVVVKAHERRRVNLSLHTGKKPVFRTHPALLAAPKIKVWFRAAGRRAQIVRPVLVEDGPRVQVYRSGVRIPDSCMYARLHVLVMHDSPNPRFYFEWGNSNPDLRPLHEDPGTVAMEVQGARVVFDEPDSKTHDHYEMSGGRTGAVLHLGGWMADGQAQCFEGRFVVSGGAPRVRALAHGWAESGAFGPFGELMPEVKIPSKWWQHEIESDQRQLAMPWAAPVHGCHPDPSNAGGQRDFGTIAMRPDVLTVDPSRLRFIARSVFQEWCRPTHFFETDLAPVRAKNHPNLVTLSGRPHFPAGKWIDTLGKPAQWLTSSMTAKDEFQRSYNGHDAQHLSINYLSAFAMTTGDRLALLEIDHHVELWLSTFTVRSGTSNDAPGASRAIGRTLLAGCWLYLLTGREDLANRIAARIRSMVPYLTAPRVGDPALLPHVMVPRFDKNRGHYWPPWEESIGVTGLAAVHEVFGLPEAGTMARLVAANIIRHSVGFTSEGWRVGYLIPFASRFRGPYVALNDPKFETDQAAGSGLTIWTMPAMVLTVRYGTDPNLRLLASRMFFDLMAERKISTNPDVLEWIGVVPR